MAAVASWTACAGVQMLAYVLRRAGSANANQLHAQIWLLGGLGSNVVCCFLEVLDREKTKNNV